MTMAVPSRFFLASLCLSVVSSLRGSHLLKKEDKGPQSQQRSRKLMEEVACVEFETVTSSVKEHALTDQICSASNSCEGGCCRAYLWLICDTNDAFPGLPCVCNVLTQDPLHFDEDLPTNSATVAAVAPAILDGNGNGSAVENATASTPFSPFVDLPAPALSTNAPTSRPTIPPDACMAGSTYLETMAIENFSFFECQNSLDCARLVPAAISSRKGDKQEKEDEFDEDGSTNSNDGSATVVSNAQEEPSPPVFCCLASMCLCGDPLGDWIGKCVPPFQGLTETSNATMPAPTTQAYVPDPTTVMTETPPPTTFQSTLIPDLTTALPASTQPPSAVSSAMTAAAPVLLQTPSPTIAVPMMPVSAAPSNGTVTESWNATHVLDFLALELSAEGAPPTSPSECRNGSFYHAHPSFADGRTDFRKCVYSYECIVAENECCLKDFCFCGIVTSGDMSLCVNGGN
jgi:hypothetical protein